MEIKKGENEEESLEEEKEIQKDEDKLALKNGPKIF